MKNQHEEHFEKQKNARAAGFTLLFLSAFFAVLFLVSWTTPSVPPPAIDEGIEVNLGNSDQGLGEVAPEIMGDPAPQESPQESVPTPSKAIAEENIPPVDNDPEPALTTVSDKKVAVVKRPEPVRTVVTNPAPPAPVPKPAVPKATMRKITGGTGTGGNGAGRNNGVTNQGIAGGKGDQGSPNGNPNSNTYSGSGSNGNSGVTIRSGLNGRRFTSFPRFQDDFNENAKVAVDIIVDAGGRVISAGINPRGTTTTNANIRAIALRNARQLRLNKGEEEADQSGTIVFDFRIKE